MRGSVCCGTCRCTVRNVLSWYIATILCIGMIMQEHKEVGVKLH